MPQKYPATFKRENLANIERSCPTIACLAETKRAQTPEEGLRGERRECTQVAYPGKKKKSCLSGQSKGTSAN